MKKRMTAMIIDLLLLVNIIIPVFYAVHKGVGKGKVRINHTVCFSFGFVYYWVLPIVFFRYFPDINDVYYQNIMSMYQAMKNNNLFFYLISILLIYCAFMAGTSVHWNHTNRKISEFKLKFRMEKVCFAFMFFLFLFAVFKNRYILFSGYLSEMERQFAGMFSAILLMICAGTLLHIVYSSEERFLKGIKSFWFVLFLVIAVTLLSTGGRLYVVSGIVAFLCLYTVFYHPIKIQHLIRIAILGMGGMAIWGYLRIGGKNAILLNSIYYLVTEPIYDAYSLVKYLSSYQIALFHIPVSLSSSFLNLVPTIIFPKKTDYIVSYEKLEYYINAPLGGVSSFASFNIDFGLIGSMIFIFLLSAWLQKIAKRNGKVWKVIYAMICSSLMFTFFRDPFSVSIVKYMFEYSFLVPCILNFVYKEKRDAYTLNNLENY